MCGIFAYKGDRNAVEVTLKGLTNLEYRGYDSCGVCFKLDDRLLVIKRQGSVDSIVNDFKRLNGISPQWVVAHTRWATHGKVSDENAHPHTSCGGEVAVVQNGVIENFQSLRERLANHALKSNTDTELIAHLTEDDLKSSRSLEQIASGLFKTLEGSFAVVAVFRDNRRVLLIRKDCPLVIGLNAPKKEVFICSDAQAIASEISEVVYMPNRTFAVIDGVRVKMFDSSGAKLPVRKETIVRSADRQPVKRFRHYMLQEIYEQRPLIRKEVVSRLSDLKSGSVIDRSASSHDVLRNRSKIVFFGCGSAWHACLYGSYLARELLGVSSEAWISSEYRYVRSAAELSSLHVAVSQSGETMDTLQCVRGLKSAGMKVLAITNNPTSQLARESDFVILQRSGVEKGVAASKTYTSQLLEILFMIMQIARDSGADISQLTDALRKLPDAIDAVFERAGKIARIARKYRRKKDFMFIGRKFNVPTALEGALKLKEITYLHAEGYAGGEMKHGPLAIVDKDLITLAVAPEDSVFAKLQSNICEIQGRGGPVVAITTSRSLKVDDSFITPKTHEYLYPILGVIPLQLFAYHVANSLGREIDKPRNLAKSVTVE